MIPKTIHFCWFSGEEKPTLVKKCIASWRRFCPGWTIREWTLEDLKEANPPRFFVDAIAARKWAFASDWARFWIVHREGGVYLDSDVELVKPMDGLLMDGPFFALSTDDPPWVDPGLGFAAERGDAVCAAIARKYETMTFDPACHLSQTSPAVANEVVRGVPSRRLLPAAVFNPKGTCAGTVRLTPETVAIHHFAASWFNWKQRLAYLWWPRVRRAPAFGSMWRNPLWVTVVFFGILCAADAIGGFGYDGTTEGYLRPALIVLRKTVTYTLLMAAPVLLLGRVAKWLMVPWFAWAVLSDAACVYAERVHHVALCDVWMPALADASSTEIAAFLRMSLTVGTATGLLALLAFVAAYGILMFRAREVRPHVGKGLLLTVPFVVFNLLLMNSSAGCAQMWFTSLPISSYISWRDQRGALQAFKNEGLPDRIPTTVPRGELPDVMIVLGESSARTHWHLYGYGRDTTPFMDARAAKGEISVLQGVTCAKPNTGPALVAVLTDVETAHQARGSWTVPEVLRRAGYATKLVSNQISDPHDDVYRVFNGCNERFYLEAHLAPGVRNHDELLLPFVERAWMDTNDAPRAIFVHLAGMHFPVRNCYPEHAAHFTGDSRINRYDNATRYQDRILDELLSIAARRPNFRFLYVSDHGETPSSSVWRDFYDPDGRAVPALVAPAQEGIPEGLRQDELTALILRLACVRGMISGKASEREERH